MSPAPHGLRDLYEWVLGDDGEIVAARVEALRRALIVVQGAAEDVGGGCLVPRAGSPRSVTVTVTVRLPGRGGGGGRGVRCGGVYGGGGGRATGRRGGKWGFTADLS